MKFKCIDCGTEIDTDDDSIWKRKAEIDYSSNPNPKQVYDYCCPNCSSWNIFEDDKE